MEPIPGTEREGSFDPDEDAPSPLFDEGGELDPDITDEQRTA